MAVATTGGAFVLTRPERCSWIMAHSTVQASTILGQFVAFVLAGGLSALALASMLRAAWPTGFIDTPNPRSLHRRPIPRVGGLAVHPAWLLACLAMLATRDPAQLQWLPIGAAAWASVLLFVVSLVDDRRHLPVWVRLPVHFACASVVVLLSPSAAGSIATASCVVLAIVWGTNLYNFMDGANGLAGGMAVIGFLAYAWIASTAGDDTMALVCASIAGAALGFLPFNFGHARVFLGDCGSIPLGFLAGALGWLGFAAGTWKWWTPVLVFLPFVADATATLIRRLARRERVWLAHRDHAYQKLVLAGWSHARLARWAYATMLACAVSASVLQRTSGATQYVSLGGAVAIVLLVLHRIEHACGNRREAASAGR